MMRIRSISQLGEFLDTQLSWRKKELTALKLSVGSARTSNQNAMLRASLCLLYAHWEGFIKEAATSYVCFVALQGLKFRDVTPNLVALGLRSEIQKAGQSNLATSHTDLAQRIMGRQDEPFRPDWNNAIDAGSNLSYLRLRQVLCVVGIEDAEYISKGPIIDERLVKNRNSIAHGQGVLIDQDEYDELHEIVIQMLDLFRNHIENAAARGTYRRISSVS